MQQEKNHEAFPVHCCICKRLRIRQDVWKCLQMKMRENISLY